VVGWYPFFWDTVYNFIQYVENIQYIMLKTAMSLSHAQISHATCKTINIMQPKLMWNTTPILTPVFQINLGYLHFSPSPLLHASTPPPVWSEVQMICIRSSWCHCHPIISVISRMVYLSDAGLPRLSWKKAVKWMYSNSSSSPSNCCETVPLWTSGMALYSCYLINSVKALLETKKHWHQTVSVTH